MDLIEIQAYDRKKPCQNDNIILFTFSSKE